MTPLDWFWYMVATLLGLGVGLLGLAVLGLAVYLVGVVALHRFWNGASKR